MKKFSDYDLEKQSDVFNFNSAVVSWISDNDDYIKEEQEDGVYTAEDALDYFVRCADLEPEPDILSEEQKAQFLFVADNLLNEGYFPHAGTL